MLPLLPVLATAVGVWGAGNALAANKKRRNARLLTEAAQEVIEQAKNRLELRTESARAAFSDLLQAKQAAKDGDLAAFSTLFQRFKQVEEASLQSEEECGGGNSHPLPSLKEGGAIVAATGNKPTKPLAGAMAKGAALSVLEKGVFGAARGAGLLTAAAALWSAGVYLSSDAACRQSRARMALADAFRFKARAEELSQRLSMSEEAAKASLAALSEARRRLLDANRDLEELQGDAWENLPRTGRETVMRAAIDACLVSTIVARSLWDEEGRQLV